ncbi:MAG TPA: hypothetical protein PKK06_15125 [Phycisphaerae bacterium]|nr:hypothetical protein [Phycisphaerae bacterium]HNU47135.1 hypothetical protein [Phycisphaerae bacterium]
MAMKTIAVTFVAVVLIAVTVGSALPSGTGMNAAGVSAPGATLADTRHRHGLPVPVEDLVVDTYFAGYGILGHGPQSCTMFHADTGESFALGNLGGFFVGAHVYVTGLVSTDSLLCWPVRTPAIEDNTIAGCFSGCGVLAHGPQSCLMIQGDNGESYAVENTGDFFIGDYVYVAGWIDEDSLACWPATIPEIRDNTIVPCFSGCGTLGRGPQDCSVIFNADDGPSYALDNLGGFHLGDHVYVNGPVDEDAQACAPVSIPRIEDNTIAACP